MRELKLKLPDAEPYQRIDGAIYDDVEMQVCVELDSNDGENIYMEAMGDASHFSEKRAQGLVKSGEAIGWVYSVYWHLAEGGVECVADYPNTNRAGAERLYCAMKAAVNLARGDMLKALEYASTSVGAKV